ncbi:MAG: hypothetical protein JW940_16105 [Polyangiaceae bacterium]|nr:hypothetical protein [Polyangiaceae bacterium]
MRILEKVGWLLSVLGVVGWCTHTASGLPYVHDGFIFAGRRDEAVFPFASSLVLLPQAQPAEAKIRAVALSTSNAWVQTESPVDLSPGAEWHPRGSPGRRIIAAAAVGRVPSAFPGADPAVPSRAAASSRVLVVASGLFPVNPFVHAGRSEANPTTPSVHGDRPLLAIANLYAQQNLTNAILVLKNTLDWMTCDPDLLEATSRSIQEYAPR